MNYFALTSCLAGLALTFSPAALAAPFCLKSQIIPPQCIYYDARQCNQEAQRQGAVCSANPAEMKLTRGAGQYCVITSARTSVCAYADRGTCDRDATSQHGTCTDSPGQKGGLPDPYSAVNGN